MIFKATVVILTLAGVTAKFAPTSFPGRCSNTQFECNNGACISKRYWCNNYGYCPDRSDTRNCHLYPNCASDQVACNADRKCIPVKWTCDDMKDCSDGSDENGCVDGYSLLKNRNNARAWLLKQRRTNYGWEGNTHRAITALYLSNPTQSDLSSSDKRLMKKQLEIQLSRDMLRGHPLPMHSLALYVHSLLSVCSDPRKFQFHDLVKELKKRLQEADTFNPFVALVLCNANSTLPTRSISKLVEIMDKQPLDPEWIEKKSYAIMALACLQNRSSALLENDFEDTNATYSFESIISNVTSSIKFFQRNNGSFGSIYTTALVLQAFQAVDDDGIGWNKIRALQYLASVQNGDGSYDGDILGTYLVLPVLNKKSLADLGHVECTEKDSHNRNLTVKEELDSINSVPQRITYSIFVGLRREIAFSITFSIPAETRFHDAMRLAEELDPRYRFKYVPYSWGNYVYSIFGVVNDPEEGRYWQLYQVKGAQYHLVDKAPDKLIIKNSGKYAYWYRPSSRHNSQPKELHFDEVLVES